MTEPVFFDASSNSLLNFETIVRPGRFRQAVKIQRIARIVPRSGGTLTGTCKVAPPRRFAFTSRVGVAFRIARSMTLTGSCFVVSAICFMAP